ncbi:hypothetical protein M9Y10_030374 [Tritrichomonas musculus]|uniref:Uncharacterized protein n=1 Tax=Tritrichomonas musculus TaxID=1915356 RepID=A0ABR2H4U5_9EUKA
MWPSFVEMKRNFSMTLSSRSAVILKIFSSMLLIKYSELKRIPSGSKSAIRKPSAFQKTVSMILFDPIFFFSLVDSLSPSCIHRIV